MKTIVKLFVPLFTMAFLVSCGSEAPATPTEWAKQPIILALGDSLTAGYGLPIEESYPSQLETLLSKEGYNYRVQNAGTSGDTSAQLLWKMDFILGGETPALAIVVIGGNDLLQSLPAEGLRNNLGAIIDTLQAKNIPVAIAGIAAPINVAPAYRAAFREAYESVASTKNVPLLPSFLDGVNLRPNLNIGDGLHPNKAGYTVITERIFEFLEKNDLLLK